VATRSELLKLAEDTAKEIKKRDALTDTLREHLRVLRELIAGIDDGSLTSGPERTNIRDDMQIDSIIARGRKVGRPLESGHPFPAWLKAQNITVTEWAEAHKDPDTGKPYKRERVKGWFADGSGGRPIPRAAADIIEKETTPPKGKSVCPATARTWKNGIRE
jgi:hypothetical protein